METNKLPEFPKELIRDLEKLKEENIIKQLSYSDKITFKLTHPKNTLDFIITEFKQVMQEHYPQLKVSLKKNIIIIE